MKINTKSIISLLIVFTVLLVSAGAVSAADDADISAVADDTVSTVAENVNTNINNANNVVNTESKINENQIVSSVYDMDDVNDDSASTYAENSTNVTNTTGNSTNGTSGNTTNGTSGNSTNGTSGNTTNGTTNITGTIVNVNNVSITYGTPYNYTINITNADGTPFAGAECSFTLFNSIGENKTYWRTSNTEGFAYLTITLVPGNWTIEAYYDGRDAGHNASNKVNGTLIVNPVNVVINSTNLNKTYGDNKTFDVTVTDDNGNKLANTTVDITLVTSAGNKTYHKVTDENGTVKMSIGLNAGEYQMITSFNGNRTYNAINMTNNVTINKANTSLNQENFTVNRKGEYYKTTLKDEFGNEITNQVVEMTLKNGNATKTYNITTNSYGNARLPINLAPGTYEIMCAYAGSTNYNAAESRNNTIVMYNSSVKMNTTLTAYNQTYTAKNQTFQISLKENNGLLLPNRQVIISLSNSLNETKNYTTNTNSMGVINFPISLNNGTYVLTSIYAGSSLFNGCNITNTITVALA